MKRKPSPTLKTSYAFLLLLLVGIFSQSCQENKPQESFLFGQGFGLNSMTLLTNDLDSSKQYFKDTLGFSFSDNKSNGSFKGSVSNHAMFADNSQLELTAVNDTVTDSQVSMILRERDGLISYALSSSAVDSTANWLFKQGYLMDSIQSYRVSKETPDGWTRDTGSPQRRALNFASRKYNPYLPQFVEQTDFDYPFAKQEWRTYYSFWRSFRKHPNGVVGTKKIHIWVANLEGVAAAFKHMGFKSISLTENEALFDISDTQQLALFSSDETPNDTTNAKLRALTFDVENLDSTFSYYTKRIPTKALTLSGTPAQLTIDTAYTFGVEFRFVQESQGQGAMATMLQMNGELDSSAVKYAAGLYDKYCALCHGENREGYAADNAPSLRSHSLLATSQGTNFMRYTIQYGRANTAMGGYISSQGGPLEYIDIEVLLKWLYDTAGVEEPIQLSRDQVLGDASLGEAVYKENCASCHGEKGEGITAPALGNPMLLATATDHFLRYAIAEGREGTPMVAFKNQLSEQEIDGVTTYLRSRASGWDVPTLDSIMIPKPADYVLNANQNVPSFTLKEGKYLPAVQLKKALDDSLRIIILDARSEVAWRQMHIPGSIPVPYYEEPEDFINDIPNDSTMIVVYCACPHAASQRVVNTLKREGYHNTAILDEGVLVWAQMGFPVRNGN